MIQYIPNLDKEYQFGILFFDGQFNDSKMCLEAIQTACSLKKEFLLTDKQSHLAQYLHNQSDIPKKRVHFRDFFVHLFISFHYFSTGNLNYFQICELNFNVKDRNIYFIFAYKSDLFNTI